MTEHNGQQPLALSDIQHICRIEEEMSFDAPFATFTWSHWQETQTRTLLVFGRFQRAIADRNVQLAAFIALEMQQMVMEMQQEVCSWLESGAREEHESDFSAGRSHERK